MASPVLGEDEEEEMVVVEEDEAVLLNEMVGEDSLEAVEGVAVAGGSIVGWVGRSSQPEH